MTVENNSGPRHLANAKLSIDMVETLHQYFSNYALDGVVTIEVTDMGLWLKNPSGGQQFLGSTEIIKTLRDLN